jgi:hypothetical protein
MELRHKYDLEFFSIVRKWSEVVIITMKRSQFDKYKDIKELITDLQPP